MRKTTRAPFEAASGADTDSTAPTPQPRTRIIRRHSPPGQRPAFGFVGEIARRADQRRRLRALLDNPTPATWADACDIPLAPGTTLFMAVAAIEPRLAADPEGFVPDALTLARVLA